MKVLIVDDEPLLLRVLERLLAAYGVQVVGAANGEVGLARASTETFDLILSDVRMPVMDGPTMLSELRARDPSPPPLVFLTGYAETGDDELLALGAVEVRSKPTDVADLLDLVRRHAIKR